MAKIQSVFVRNRQYYYLDPDQRFFDQIEFEPNTGCWLWTGLILATGYACMSVHGKQIKLHRWAYSRFNNKPQVPSHLDVCHRCDVPSCVNPGHLFVGTRLDNMRDCVKKGRTRKGSKHHNSILSESLVSQIKDRLAKGHGVCVLAREYKVSPMTISDIKRGATWGHV